MPETSTVRYERTSPQVAKITFANPPVNLVVGETVARLSQIVKEGAADPDIQVVVFDSAILDFFYNHFDLAAAADFPASREKAIFGQPEVGSGLSTDLGSTSASPTSGTQSWKNAHRRN